MDLPSAAASAYNAGLTPGDPASQGPEFSDFAREAMACAFR